MEKCQKLRSKITELMSMKRCTTRRLEEVIGYLNSCTPAVAYGPLYLKRLEIDKTNSLAQALGQFDKHIHLTAGSKEDLNWWLNTDNIYLGLPIVRSVPSIDLYTDASLKGYGNLCGNKYGGQWRKDDIDRFGSNINALKFLAVKFALQMLISTLASKHVRLRVDNVTAVTYINHFGGCKSVLCNDIA